MRIFRTLRPMAAITALAVSAPVSASMTYTFNTNPNAGNYGDYASFTTPDFITSPFTTITSFDSCTVGFGPLVGGVSEPCASIYVTLTSGSPSLIQLNGATLTQSVSFAEGAFSTLGTNYGPLVFSTTASTLVVVQNGTAVPEPATWAMMLLGFGGIGVEMRRRRQFLARA